MATPATINTHNLPNVVLIGRANVGKSTLFNTLTETHKALVSSISGTTRNNNEALVLWKAKYFNLIDTGGVDNSENEKFINEILAQSESALQEADIIIMVIDTKTGILPQEIELARKLNLKYKDVKKILVANKADAKKYDLNLDARDCAKLQLGSPIFISATNGRGTGDLLDVLYSEFNKLKIRPKKIKEEKNENIKIALIGKPNVGKSSIFNKLIGQDKVIVSDIAHTTREPFDTDMHFEYEDKKYNLTFIDTAGIRRKNKVQGKLEREGIFKSIESIEKVDLILLVLDANEPIASQDMQLAGLIEKRSRSVMILLNKWDLAEENEDRFRNDTKKLIYAHFPHLDFAPILFVSGKTGYKIHQIFPDIIKIMEARKTEIPRYTLDKFIDTITQEHRPSRGKGIRHPKVIGFRQIATNPPVFELFIKYRTSLHRSYINYIENKLRESFNFYGTPIIIKLRKAKK